MSPRPIPRFRSTSGFTLTEVIISSFLSTIVVAAVIALAVASLRVYYVESDYIEIGGQNRRLTDDLIENGTTIDDLAVFRDIGELVSVPAGDRGDCLMLFNRASDGTGRITDFTCYYLARTSGPTSGVSLWKVESRTPLAPFTPNTTDPATALTNYPRSGGAKRVSGDIFKGTFPRLMPTLTTPITPRAGIFTNDDVRSSSSPTVLVNLPARLTGRGNTTNKATSNVTFAISPRR